MKTTDTPETDYFLVRMSARKRQWETVADWATAHNATLEHARKLERERDGAISAIEAIEVIYIDGCDTYEDWKAMGTIAREFLENAQAIATAPEVEPDKI